MDFTAPSKKPASSAPHPSGSDSGTGASGADAPVDKKTSYAEHMAAQDKRRNDAELVRTFQGIDEAFETMRIERLAHERAIELHRQDRARIEPVLKEPNRPKDRSLDESAEDKLARETANSQPKKSDAKQPEGSEAKSSKVVAEAKQPKPNYGIDPALADPWDLTPEGRAAAKPAAEEAGDPFSPFRAAKAIPLEMPSSVMSFDDTDQANLADFGIVAARERWPKELAQSFVDQAAVDFRTEKSRPDAEGNYDPQRTVSELRSEWGEHTESTLYEIAAFCEKRPALSAWLDSTGLGSSPAVLRMLAAAAKDPTLLTKTGAKKFVDSIGSNEAYWRGDKIQLAMAKLAFLLADTK